MHRLILKDCLNYIMSWKGDPVLTGLNIVRARFGERAYRFILRFARRREYPSRIPGRLEEIGKLAGLNAEESAAAVVGAKAAAAFPLWLKAVLSAIAIGGGAFVVWYVATGQHLYQPGTLYGSLSPNDFIQAL